MRLLCFTRRMVHPLIVLPALFFFGMGVAGLARPAFVLGLFGVRVDTASGRSEVRAVYGGFGLVVAALLASVVLAPQPWSSGIVVTVGASVGAMAIGRMIGAIWERDFSPYPTLFFALVEAALCASLLGAAALQLGWWHVS
jgi:hypothetical protein